MKLEVWLQNGSERTSLLASWYSAAQQRYLWGLVPLLQAAGILGRHAKFKDIFSDSEARWTQWIEALGLPVALHLGKSRKSLVQQRDRAVDQEVQAEDEHWCSSLTLLVLLAEWSVSRGSLADREDSGALLAAFLRKTREEPFLGSLLVERVADGVSLLCHIGGSPPPCSCLRKALSGDGKMTSTSQSFSKRLLALALVRGDCRASASLWASLVSRVAEHVEGRREQWGNFDVLGWQVASLPEGRKRRVHDSFQRQAAAKMSKTVATRSTSELERKGVKRQTLQSWQEQFLSRSMAQQHLLCSGALVLDSCFDAARVGTPGVELLLHAGRFGTSAVVLPPAVPASRMQVRVSQSTRNYVWG